MTTLDLRFGRVTLTPLRGVSKARQVGEVFLPYHDGLLWSAHLIARSGRI
ncbi:hypothetical protein [Sphingopyxis sp. P1IMeth2]|nr:hypothetical protein [Sphingopyxis sp. P1IMeth2]